MAVEAAKLIEQAYKEVFKGYNSKENLTGENDENTGARFEDTMQQTITIEGDNTVWVKEIEPPLVQPIVDNLAILEINK